jgi:hypothetical protein
MNKTRRRFRNQQLLGGLRKLRNLLKRIDEMTRWEGERTLEVIEQTDQDQDGGNRRRKGHREAGECSTALNSRHANEHGKHNAKRD